MNREVAIPGGAGIYPLQGDVQSIAGNQNVTVIGIQNTPVEAGVPPLGAKLHYNQNANQWQQVQQSALYVNGMPVSDDFDMFVNAVQVYVNGTPVAP